jgi:hypothetical protein
MRGSAGLPVRRQNQAGAAPRAATGTFLYIPGTLMDSSTIGIIEFGIVITLALVVVLFARRGH